MEGLPSDSTATQQLHTAIPQSLLIKRTISGRPTSKRFAQQFAPSPYGTTLHQNVDASHNDERANPLLPTNEWRAVQCLKKHSDEEVLRWLDYARYRDRNEISPQYPQQRDSLTSSINTRSSILSAASSRTSYSRHSLYSDSTYLDNPPLPPLVPATAPVPPLSPSCASTVILGDPQSILNKDTALRKRPSSSLPKYLCTFCDSDKGFPRKGDWKSHEIEFHERQDEYACTLCDGKFYFKHRFIRHHSSRHGCVDCPHVDTCRSTLPKKRAWGCGFCGQYLPTLATRFEHIAEHYEAGMTKSEWDHSLVILGLLQQPDVVGPWSLLLDKVGVFDWSTCSWSKETTNELQIGLELEGLKTGNTLAMEAYSVMKVIAPETEAGLASATWIRRPDLTMNTRLVAATPGSDLGGGFNPRSETLSDTDVSLLSLGRDSSALYGYESNQYSPRHGHSHPESSDEAFILGGYQFPRVPRHESSFFDDGD